jgi:hypothetical protein
MRPSNKQRSRNKSGSGGHNNQRRSMGNIVNRVFESAGPDGKVRGTPQQIIDKYQALARDAQVSGDRVAAESFLQHSEHYSRMLGEAMRQQMEQRASQERDDNGRADDQRSGENRDDGGRNSDQRTSENRDDGGRGNEQRMGDTRDSRDDGGRSNDQRPEPQENRDRVQPREPSGLASGMATFDSDEREASGGLIETPEGRSKPAKAPAPQPVAAEVNGSDHTAAVVTADSPPPRRPRTRRRAKPDATDAPVATD